jgi:hypothetical protein
MRQKTEVQHDPIREGVADSVANEKDKPSDYQGPSETAAVPGTSSSRDNLLGGRAKEARSSGRPTKEQAVEIARERAARQAAKLTANPPKRCSTRLAQKSSNQNSHLEGGRYCNAILDLIR